MRVTDAGSLPDLLGWAYLAQEGTLLLKDGSLMRSWRYRGPDVARSTLAARRRLARHVNEALLPVRGEGLLYFDALRRPASGYAPVGDFPGPLTALIDEERRRAFTDGSLYASGYYLTFVQGPPKHNERIGRFFMKGVSTGVDWDARLAAFDEAAGALAMRLSGALDIQALSSDELMAYLHACLGTNGPSPKAPVPSMEISATLAAETLLGGMRPMMGPRHVRVVAITGFPESTDAGDLDFLARTGGALRWTTRFIPLSGEEAASSLRRRQLMWFQKRRGLSSWLIDIISKREKNAYQMRQEEQFFDQDAAKRSEEMAGAIAENAASEAAFGYFTAAITVMDEDESAADDAARQVLKALQDRGYAARIEDVNAVEAYLGSLPGHGYYNVRRPILSSLSVVHLVPMSSLWPGRAFNPSPYFPKESPPLLYGRSSGSPFRLSLHVGDVGHTLVVGRTGAGKSVLVGTLAAQWLRYRGSQVFLFDLGYSAATLALAAGGHHYDMAAGRPGSIPLQPLAEIHEAAERAWSMDWLETLCALQGLAVTPALRSNMAYSLSLLAASPREYRTLTELWAQVRDEALREALAPYTATGDLGLLLDGSVDGVRDQALNQRLHVFELSHLMDLSDKALIPALLHLFRCVESRLSAERPTLILIEEAWAAFMHGVFAQKIRQWLLTLRKQNAAVVLVAHSASQLAAPEARLITESCPTRIFLPNPDAMQMRGYYEALGLTEPELRLVASAQMKRDYLVRSPEGSSLIDLSVGKVLKAFLTPLPPRSASESLEAAQSLQIEHGPTWPAEWLRLKGLDAAAEEFEAMAGGSPKEASPQPLIMSS